MHIVYSLGTFDFNQRENLSTDLIIREFVS